MLRIATCLLFLSSCSLGVLKTGGKGNYVYDPGKDYTSEELKALAPEVVTTSRRNPPVGTLEKLFGETSAPLKRIGIVVFESQIQPTRSGLAGEDQIYLSEAGKQLLTEKLFSVWEQVITTLSPDIDYVPSHRLKRAKSFKLFGEQVDDAIKSSRNSLDPDDIFYLEKGKYTTTATLLNPRGMRDLSLILVPATELMGGPKWSEHQKHFVNELSMELGLDAALVVMSELSWTAARSAKHSGEEVPEEIRLKLGSSVLTSLSDYRKRAAKTGEKDPPGVNLCYRSYEAQLNMPARFSALPAKRTFGTIESELLAPLLKTYIDLSVMMIHQVSEDLRKTH